MRTVGPHAKDCARGASSQLTPSSSDESKTNRSSSGHQEAGFELVRGFACQVIVFGLLPVLCSEREGRSSPRRLRSSSRRLSSFKDRDGDLRR